MPWGKHELPFLGMDLEMSFRITLILQIRKLRLKCMDTLAKVAELMSRETAHQNTTLLLQEPARWSGL